MVFAVDDEERPFPSRFREEVDGHAEQLLNALRRRRLWRCRRSLERPIDHERAPFDHRARHGAPVARVARTIAVVAHRKILPLADRVWTELIPRSVRLRKLRL